MSANNPSPILTNHAMLVAWGLYARQIGLVEAIEAVRLHQKRRDHRPQTKVIESVRAPVREPRLMRSSNLGESG